MPAQPEIQGSKETEKRPRFDTIIVFGQGPVKEIKPKNKLTEEERGAWEKFKKNPRGTEDLDFYAVESKNPKDLEKYQHLGRFALKRLGRFNALAAGYALVRGQTRELILSGGHTQNKQTREAREPKLIEFYKENGQEKKIEDYANLSQAQKNLMLDDFAAKVVHWPSEAELMKDVIVRRYAEEYKKKFGRDISEVIKLEDRATNTLENFALTINKNPDILSKKVGLLSVNHHLRRILLLANRFGMDSTKDDEISAQMELEERARSRAKKAYDKLMQTNLPEENKWERGEKRWIAGLKEPEFINYWVGYVSEIKDPAILQRIIGKMNSTEWSQAIRSAFSQVGLDFGEFEHEDLIRLQKENPAKYSELREKLSGLLRFRTLPPESLET